MSNSYLGDGAVNKCILYAASLVVMFVCVGCGDRRSEFFKSPSDRNESQSVVPFPKMYKGEGFLLYVLVVKPKIVGDVSTSSDRIVSARIRRVDDDDYSDISVDDANDLIMSGKVSLLRDQAVPQ